MRRSRGLHDGFGCSRRLRRGLRCSCGLYRGLPRSRRLYRALRWSRGLDRGWRCRRQLCRGLGRSAGLHHGLRRSRWLCPGLWSAQTRTSKQDRATPNDQLARLFRPLSGHCSPLCLTDPGSSLERLIKCPTSVLGTLHNGFETGMAGAACPSVPHNCFARGSLYQP